MKHCNDRGIASVYMLHIRHDILSRSSEVEIFTSMFLLYGMSVKICIEFGTNKLAIFT